jgi:hypothetical protein
VTAGMVSCMLLCWGWFLRVLVNLASSPYSSDFLVPGGGWFASRVLLCVRVRRLHAFGSFLVDYSVLYFTA